MTGANASTFETIEDRFFSKVVAGPNNCWVWAARRNEDGYGQFWFDGSMGRAHRFSWSLHNGMEIPEGLQVMHSCDNPPCVNPDHLSLGTNVENQADSYRKGRGNNPKGEAHGCAKLTAEQVFEIQSMDRTHRSQRSIAVQFGVSQKTIWRILNGKGWSA